MKRILTLALVGSALVAAPAFAATGTATIGGNVTAVCVLAPSATITLGEMINLSDGLYNNVANGTSTTLAGFCNGATATMSVVANPIQLTTVHSTPTGFTDTVNYTATASVTPAGAGAPVSTSDSTTAAAAAAVTVGLFSGNVTVALSASSTNGSKLIAGPYSGTTVVTLTPSVAPPP